MAKKKEVLIFYSSDTEPELPIMYKEGIAYLHEQGIKTSFIDVIKNPNLAEKHKILVTPVFIIKDGAFTKKYLGVVDGLKKLLETTLGGKSILHALGFKEGRDVGRKVHFKDKNQLEKDLELNIINKGVSAFKVIRYDGKNNDVKIRLISDIAKDSKISKTPVCFSVASFLGGIFTEILHKGVHFGETQCMAQGNSYCEFETIKEDKKVQKNGSRK